MHLYKPTYTAKIPQHAERIMIDNKPHARWIAKNKRVITGIVCATDSGKCLVEVECYYIEYRDPETGRRRPPIRCFPSFAASEAKMLELSVKMKKVASGDMTESAVLRQGKTVRGMIVEWEESMRERELTESHVKKNVSRVSAIRDAINAQKLLDFTFSRVNKVLYHWRSTKEKFSAQTSNHYITSVRTFLNWCIKSRYIESDPMHDAERLETRHRRTFERRALSDAEVKKLLESTRMTQLHRCPISGFDRSMLYLVALYTGYRASELGMLTRRSFLLSGDHPAIVLHARGTKNKEHARQPIPKRIAAELQSWIDQLPPGRKLWVGHYFSDKKTQILIRGDLNAAGIPYENEDGKFDFHALRTTYITSLARSGISIQYAQKLARHKSITTTIEFYTRLGMTDLSLEIEKLPNFLK